MDIDEIKELVRLREEITQLDFKWNNLEKINQIVTDFHISLGLLNLYSNDTEIFYFNHELTVIEETIKDSSLSNEEMKNDLDESKNSIIERMLNYIEKAKLLDHE